MYPSRCVSAEKSAKWLDNVLAFMQAILCKPYIGLARFRPQSSITRSLYEDRPHDLNGMYKCSRIDPNKYSFRNRFIYMITLSFRSPEEPSKSPHWCPSSPSTIRTSTPETMHFFTLASLLPFVHLTIAFPQPIQALTSRACEAKYLTPSDYYQIYEESTFTNQTSGLGPFYPDGSFSFAVSQQANIVNERDLIASFKNVSCPPATSGPFKLEFLFLPDKTGKKYTVSGSNTRVDVFTINGELPYFSDFYGTIYEFPRWSTTNKQTGPRIGSFKFPTGSAVHKERTLLSLKVECKATINLRFSITNDSPKAGDINYFHGKKAGLRIRYGC